MRKIAVAAVWLALSLGAWAQISSNGPVIADYGKHMTSSDPVETKIAKEVRHELLMLPWYSLFDDLEFSVEERTVTLSGDLTSEHAVTKSDAGNAVKHIEGVDKVINNIQILPPSPLDTRVREQTYAALSRGPLSRYFWEATEYPHHREEPASDAQGNRQQRRRQEPGNDSGQHRTGCLSGHE